MKRTTEIHIFEHFVAVPPMSGDQGDDNSQFLSVSVRYVEEENLAHVAIRSASTKPIERALIAPLLPVGAPEGCSGVHVEAVISGRLKELGGHRAQKLAEYVVGHITSVCNPGVPEQPGFTPRYDFPQSGAPMFLRSCAIESCGVPADVPEGSMAHGEVL